MDEIHQHFATIGLKPGATPEEVKQAYRDLIMVWHPDRFPADSRLQQMAQEKTKQINIAYQAFKSRLDGSESQISGAGRTSTNAGNPNQERKSTSSTSSNHRSHQKRSNQRTAPGTTKAREKRSTAVASDISTSVGVLIIVIGAASGAVLFSPQYAGVPVWKMLLSESLMYVSPVSLLKANKDHPRSTFLNYLKVSVATTLWICIGIAMLTVRLFKATAGRSATT